MRFCRIGALVTMCVLAPFLVSAQASTDFTIDMRYGENTDPPTVPTDVEVTPISPFQIDITWSASVDPFGVAGYQVFRDSVQVATTLLTDFSDTGLSASTTYTYTIRAFDVDGLTSSSSIPVATTTFELPPPPPPLETATSQTSGSFFIPRLQNFTLDVGSEAARFDFGVNFPVTYRIQYGMGDAPSSRTVQTETLRQQHTTVITDLVSNTTYFYDLYTTDRYGRETLLRSGSFTTEEQFGITMPSNVAEFSAQAIGGDVLLRWVAAPQSPYTYVRVVRNPRFFPNDPGDGVVIYQGPGNAFTDIGAMQGVERQYYTIFAYNLSGIPSSGMLAIAARTPTVPSPPPVVIEETEDETDIPPLPPVSLMTLANIEFIQNDRLQSLAESVVLTTDNSFMVRVLASYIPPETRAVMVTLWQSEDDRYQSFLLRLDVDSGYFKTVIPAQSRIGTYDIRLELYNGLQERFFSLSGLFAVAEPTEQPPSPVDEDLILISFLYMLLGGIMGIIVVLGLHRFFMLLWRRRSRDDETKAGAKK